MEVQRPTNYLKFAESLGVDTDNPRQVEDLIACINYVSVKFTDRRLRDTDIVDQIGITYDQLLRLKVTNTYKIASRLVLAEFMTNKARSDVRNEMFQILQSYMPSALMNISRIAAGEPRMSDDGKMVRPHYRDQVAAYTALINSPMANAWLANTFVGESTKPEELAHLDMRAKLLEDLHIPDLDTQDVVEAEVKPVAENQDAQ